MTTRANYREDQSFDENDAPEEELELSSGKKLLAAADLVAWQLRRAVVFVPAFGVVFLAIGFLWFQSISEESSLKGQAEQLSILLAQPEPQPEMLLRQADGWDTAYQVVMDGRVVRPADSDLIERVIDAAAESGIVIIETGTTADGVIAIQNENYTSTPILIGAIGTIEGIEDYLALLETSEFAAFRIEATIIEAGPTGYQLTLKGEYYSLPEDFGTEVVNDKEVVIAVAPIVPVDSGGAE